MKKNKPRFDVTSPGSAMIRLSVPRGQRLENAPCYEVRTAGSESNTLAALYLKWEQEPHGCPAYAEIP